MRPQRFFTRSSPLPHLPLEIKHHILRFCDPSTLGQTSRVSLAFLELSSPILYQDIEIVGLKNVEKLFCLRESGLDHPHLHPHLSLAHVRKLTLIATSEVEGTLNLFPSRFPPPSSSLLVDLLVLHPLGYQTEDEEEKYLPQWSSLLPILDPTSVRVVGQDIKPSSRLPSIDLETAPWPNLVRLYFDRAGSTKFVSGSLFAVSSTTLMTVVFDLAVLWEEEEEQTGVDRLEEVIARLGPDCLDGWPDGKLKGYVVDLMSQDDADKLEEWVKELWEGEGRTDWDSHRSKVCFEFVAPPKLSNSRQRSSRLSPPTAPGNPPDLL